MNFSENTGLLKVYVGESDKVHNRPLYEEIVFDARKAGLAGATVYKGFMSFGASHSVHTMKIFALSGDMPVLIEIIDTKDKLELFANHINELMELSKKGGLITFQDLKVLRYEKGEKYKNLNGS
jgi:PII-like signaling protein